MVLEAQLQLHLVKYLLVGKGEMQILFATTNSHKLGEARDILHPHNITTTGLDSLSSTFQEPIEDSDTFAGNARIKALSYAQVTGLRCMADDSGLVVDALGGAPGVHSARFAGVGANRAERDKANNLLLLKRLQGVPNDLRTARFVCSLCIADPDGLIVAESEGTFEGIIAVKPEGTNGFGYDPLLYVPDAGVTSAQMLPDEKNLRSHRSAAIHSILEHLSS